MYLTAKDTVKRYCCPSCVWKLKCLATNHPVDSDWNEMAHECHEMWANERNSGTLWKDIPSPEYYQKIIDDLKRE
jgi:basic membrane lipoprotein Med (substrate-binding protein (PBP1-ABC) superfamily)